MKTLALAALVAFGALNVYAFAAAGIGALGTALLGVNAWSAVIAADLTIALGMACTWMYRDATRRGKSAIPYIALTIATGSIGTLLYVLMRDEESVG